MLKPILFAFFAVTFVSANDSGPLSSGVWTWAQLPVETTAVGERRAINDQPTLDFRRFLVHATTLNGGREAHPPHAHPELEELVIVKSGQLRVRWGDEEKVIGPGSFALLTNGVTHGLANAGAEPVTYYVIRYQTAPGAGASGGEASASESLVSDWAEIPLQPFATGGRRQLFDRPTPMLENFEVHVTTLNAGLQNHATHTHRVEELVVILKGEVEMQIGEQWHRAVAGDLVYLASQVPHALRNVGDGPTEYYAIQWRVKPAAAAAE